MDLPSSELLCCENASMDLDMTVKTYIDPVVLKDDRVLENLLKTEEQYMPSASFFSVLQTEVKPEMREVVAHWMLQVCQEEERDEEVFTLAMNMMDRFMSLVKVGKGQLQLLGAVCLFLASKMKENPPFKPEKLAYYTSNSVTLQEIRQWELLVLARLKWDLSAITPHAFLDQILERLHLNLREDVIQMVKDHATFFIKVCTTDSRFTSNPPSMIAAAAVSAAIQGILRLPTQPQHSQYPEQANTSQDSSYSSSLHDHRTSYDSSYDMDSDELGAVGRDYSRLEESSSSYHSESSGAEAYSGARGPESSLSSLSSLSDHHSSAQEYMENLYQNLHHITHIDTDCLKECHRQIEIWTQNNGESPSTSGTPTEVQDVDF